ncbi:hypothetical protein APD43_12150, partial [Acinetobacter baumannii]
KFDWIFDKGRHAASWFNVFKFFIAGFTNAVILHQSGDVEVMADCIALIFTFHTEMIASHAHLYWVVCSVFMQ